MALTATLLTSGATGWENAQQTGFTTASITPGANCALLVLVGVTSEGEVGGPDRFTGSTMTSTGATWTMLSAASGAVGAFRSQAAAFGTTYTTAPGAITITWATPVITGPVTLQVRPVVYAVYRITGHDPATPFGGVANQFNGPGNDATSITLSAAPTVDDLVFALSLATADSSAPGGAVFGAGTWVESLDGASFSARAIWNSGYRSASTSTTVAWSDVNVPAGVGSENYESGQVAVVVRNLDVTGPQTWTGSPGTVTVTGTSDVWSVIGGAQGWVGSAGSISVSGSSGTWGEPTGHRFPASISGRRVLDQFGDPWIMVGDCFWTMTMNLTDEQIAESLTIMGGLGFNCLEWAAVGLDKTFEGSGSGPGPAGTKGYINVYGENAFTGAKWTSAHNDAYWDRIRTACEVARDVGITMMINVAYAGNSSSATTDGCSEDLRYVGDPTVMNTHADYLYDLLGDLPNIIWQVGGDSWHGEYPSGNGMTPYFNNFVNRMITTNGSTHLWTGHCQEGTTSAQWGNYPGAPNEFTLDFVQLNGTYYRAENTADRADATFAAEPVLLPQYPMEGPFEDEHWMDAVTLSNPEMWRSWHWGSLLRGCCGSLMGNNPRWHCASGGFFNPYPGWGEDPWDIVLLSFTSPITRAYGHAARFDKWIDWATINPDAGPLITAGEGTGAVRIAASYSTTQVAAYFPNGGTATFDLSLLTGPDTVVTMWYDPTSGALTTGTTYATTGTQAFTTPGSNSEGDSDWVLLLAEEPPVLDQTWTRSAATVTVEAASGTWEVYHPFSKFRLGSTDIVEMKLGGTSVQQAYVGSTLIWETVVPPVWVGNPGTITVEATSGTWVVTGGPQTWTANAGTVAVTGTSGTWALAAAGPELVAGAGANWDAQDSVFTYSSGVEVASWSDLSGNSRNMTRLGGPGTGGARSGSIHGHPAVAFDSSDWLWVDGFTPPAQPYTMYLVIAPNLLVSGLIPFFGAGGVFIGRYSGIASDSIFFTGGHPANYSVVGVNADPHLIVCRFSGATGLQRIDGITVGTADMGTGALNGLRMSDSGGGGVFTLGHWIYYPAAHTLAQIEQNEEYLIDHWDLPPAGVNVTVSHVGAGGFVSGAGGPPVDLPDWSVTAGELLIVGLGGCSTSLTTADPPFSLSGGSLTWTRVAQGRNSAVAFTAQTVLYSAVAATSTTITDLVAEGQPDALDVCYAMYRVTRYDPSDPFGAVAGLADGTSDGTKDITLDTTPGALSTVLAVCFCNANDNNATKSIDAGTSDGWVEDFDYSPSMSGANMWGSWQGQHRQSLNMTRVRWDDIKPSTVTATIYSFSGCAIEIRPAPA